MQTSRFRLLFQPLEGTNPSGTTNAKVTLTFDDGAAIPQNWVITKHADSTVGLGPYGKVATNAFGEALYQCKKFNVEYYPDGKPPAMAVFNMNDLAEQTKANYGSRRSMVTSSISKTL